MNTKSLFRFSFVALLFATVTVSCKKNYEAPPEAADPNLTATTTIKALKARHTVSGAYDMINDDAIISGVVIANDKSGNLYKEMYIRDATGAIALELSGTLYTNFPVGRRVFVKCKGLCISDYNNMMQLGVRAIVNGSPTLEAVPTPLVANYVIGGSLNNFEEAKPKVVTQADLNLTGSFMQFPLLGDLIQLNDFEFQLGDTKKTYGDTSAYKKAGEVYIKSCGGTSSLLVRTSGYADFAGKNPQNGNGSIVAIYTVYNTTKQLIIRDTTDVKFSGPRCFLFEEDFQAYPTTGAAPLVISGWKNIQESGDVPYTLASFGSSIFPKVSAFTSSALPTTNITSWLISPAIAIPTGIAPKYTYTCAHRYTVGTLKALVSTNYTGSGNPSAATWVEFNSIQANSPTFTPFIPYGPFDLSAYGGNSIYLAFRYDVPAGSNKNAVATFEPDDMKISKN
ncbi:MAG: DUF5689 domain-containing protein [Chitinophagaceae bacterium]